MHYTYEDMQLAYNEGAQKAMQDEGYAAKGLSFVDFMYKNYPEETIPQYKLYWSVEGEQHDQMILAVSMFEARKEALSILNTKKIFPDSFEVRKVD